MRDPSAWHIMCSYLRANTLPQVSAILLDPSCSGSGTAAQRLDHLLPSRTTDIVDTERLNKLAAFQKKALAHALSCMFSFLIDSNTLILQLLSWYPSCNVKLLISPEPYTSQNERVLRRRVSRKCGIWKLLAAITCLLLCTSKRSN